MLEVRYIGDGRVVEISTYVRCTHTVVSLVLNLE